MSILKTLMKIMNNVSNHMPVNMAIWSSGHLVNMVIFHLVIWSFGQ